MPLNETPLMKIFCVRHCLALPVRENISFVLIIRDRKRVLNGRSKFQLNNNTYAHCIAAQSPQGKTSRTIQHMLVHCLSLY